MSGGFGILHAALKLALPAYLAFVGASALHGYMSPWQPAENVFAERAGQTPIAIDFGKGGGDEGPGASRSYVLFPDVLTDPKVIVVSQGPDQPPVALDSRVRFWLGMLWTALSLYGTWFFWIRRTRKGAV